MRPIPRVPAVHNVNLHAWRFGQPCPGQAISVLVTTSGSPPPGPPGLRPPGQGSPSPFPAAVAGCEVPRPITIPPTGFGVLTLTSIEAPAPPRPGIDGQIFEAVLHWGSIVNPSTYIRSVIVRVFDEVIRPRGDPSWNHVREIFMRYSRLFPYMATTMPNPLDLGVESTFDTQQNLQRIKTVLLLDFELAAYMPVTRDLSGAKRTLLVDFLNARARERGWPI